MSDTNHTRVGYVEETTFGTTPSANLQLLRNTGGNLHPQKSTTSSGEIRSDLRPSEPVETGQWSSGSIDVEWSHTTLDDILEGMLYDSWTSNVLQDGTTEKSYTFETQYVDPSISPSQYVIHKGCRIESVSMSLATQSIVTGSFGVLGTTPSIAQASAGTGNTSETTTDVYQTVDYVTTLTEGDAATTESSLTRVTGVDLNLSRNLREQFEIGDLNPTDIGSGMLSVTGTIQQYFKNDTLMDAWFNHSDRSLTITLDDNGTAGGGNTITIEIPKFRYTGEANVSRPGPDNDAIVSMDFEAYATTSDSFLIQITRS